VVNKNYLIAIALFCMSFSITYGIMDYFSEVNRLKREYVRLLEENYERSKAYSSQLEALVDERDKDLHELQTVMQQHLKQHPEIETSDK
jgi:hypothetical protein